MVIRSRSTIAKPIDHSTEPLYYYERHVDNSGDPVYLSVVFELNHTVIHAYTYTCTAVRIYGKSPPSQFACTSSVAYYGRGPYMHTDFNYSLAGHLSHHGCARVCTSIYTRACNGQQYFATPYILTSLSLSLTQRDSPLPTFRLAFVPRKRAMHRATRRRVYSRATTRSTIRFIAVNLLSTRVTSFLVLLLHRCLLKLQSTDTYLHSDA